MTLASASFADRTPLARARDAAATEAARRAAASEATTRKATGTRATATTNATACDAAELAPLSPSSRAFRNLRGVASSVYGRSRFADESVQREEELAHAFSRRRRDEPEVDAALLREGPWPSPTPHGLRLSSVHVTIGGRFRYLGVELRGFAVQRVEIGEGQRPSEGPTVKQQQRARPSSTVLQEADAQADALAAPGMSPGMSAITKLPSSPTATTPRCGTSASNG